MRTLIFTFYILLLLGLIISLLIVGMSMMYPKGVAILAVLLIPSLIIYPFVYKYVEKEKDAFIFHYNASINKVIVKDMVDPEEHAMWLGYNGDLRDITVMRVISHDNINPLMEGVVFGYSQVNATKVLKRWTKKYKNE